MVLTLNLWPNPVVWPSKMKPLGQYFHMVSCDDDDDDKVVLTSESVHKILWCDHSNETSLPVLSHGAICFATFYKNKIGNFVEIWLCPLLTAKGLKQQYPSDVAPLTVTHKFFAAPKPPGKTRASWCVASSSAREEIFPRAIRADSAKTFLTGN